MLSCEICFSMSESALAQIRDTMANYGYITEIILYLRPWKAFRESEFQEYIKAGIVTFPRDPVMDYPKRIQLLQSVFGKPNVRVYNYVPQGFPAGCVVRHFCLEVGIAVDFEKYIQVNTSLSLPAIRLLYAYHTFRKGIPGGTRHYPGNYSFIEQLLQVPGEALRLHSCLYESWLPFMEQQNAWLEAEFGFSLEEDIYAYDTMAGVVRSADDLYHLGGEEWSWLSSKTAIVPPGMAAVDAHETAREVAFWIHQWRVQLAYQQASLRMRLKWWWQDSMQRLQSPIT